MRACLLAIVAAFVCAATGCANFSHGRRGDCNAAVPCSEPVACSQPVGCAAPIGCTAAVSPYAPAVAAMPAGVSPYAPASAEMPAGVAPYAPAVAAMPAGVAPYAPAGVGPYGQYGHGYGHGHGHFAHHRGPAYGGPAGPPTAQVAYPYYTTRGPRDFLLDNPPSIGR